MGVLAMGLGENLTAEVHQTWTKFYSIVKTGIVHALFLPRVVPDLFISNPNDIKTCSKNLDVPSPDDFSTGSTGIGSEVQPLSPMTPLSPLSPASPSGYYNFPATPVRGPNNKQNLSAFVQGRN